MQIKTSFRHHVTPVRVAIIKITNSKCWQGCRSGNDNCSWKSTGLDVCPQSQGACLDRLVRGQGVAQFCRACLVHGRPLTPSSGAPKEKERRRGRRERVRERRTRGTEKGREEGMEEGREKERGGKREEEGEKGSEGGVQRLPLKKCKSLRD